jgi:hypothetical protein
VSPARSSIALLTFKCGPFGRPSLRWTKANVAGVSKVPTIFQQARKMGREGIVSKRLSAPYRSGPSRDWIKVKNPDSPTMIRAREAVWSRCGPGGHRCGPRRIIRSDDRRCRATRHQRISQKDRRTGGEHRPRLGPNIAEW